MNKYNSTGQYKNFTEVGLVLWLSHFVDILRFWKIHYICKKVCWSPFPAPTQFDDVINGLRQNTAYELSADNLFMNRWEWFPSEMKLMLMTYNIYPSFTYWCWSHLLPLLLRR